MNLLVCISKTPETTAKISFVEGDTKFNTEGVQYIMNPYDEWYSLVRALELKEAQGGKVIAFNVGQADNDIIIRKALAIGADEAVRVNADDSSALFVARQIAAYAISNDIDIIFLGKETINYNGSEVGAMVSEILDFPYLSYASKLDMNGNTATIQTDIEGGVEVVEVDTPFVISGSKGLAEQRIPNMRGIMMAKRKPLTVIDPIEQDGMVEYLSYTLPAGKSAVKMLDPENMDELVRLLHEEAKVI